ncbi:hypothetical protein CL622_03260 [archaeon]|nr:hypothetical protein [archaeon]
MGKKILFLLLGLVLLSSFPLVQSYGGGGSRPSPQSDLAIVDLTTSSSLHAGANIYLSTTIENIGDKATPTDEMGTVTWYIDDEEFFEETVNLYVYPKDQNGNTPRFYAWWNNAFIGKHKIRVELKAPNLYEETTSNNEFETTFTITQSGEVDIKEIYLKELSSRSWGLYAVIDSEVDPRKITYKITQLDRGDIIYDRVGSTDVNIRGGGKVFDFNEREGAYLLTELPKSEIISDSSLTLTVGSGTALDTTNVMLEYLDQVIVHPFCDDTDGIDPFTKGSSGSIEKDTQVINENNLTDTCNGDILAEYYCVGKKMEHALIQCPLGCSSGACDPVTLDTTDESQSIIEIETAAECSGCLIDSSSCLPTGTQVTIFEEGYYCSVDKTLDSQKTLESFCQSDFECSTNLCIDGSCVSSGLWQRFVKLFSRWF